MGLSEQDVIDLANANLLPSLRLPGEFLRFRKDDILKVKETIKKKYNLPEKKYQFAEKLREFIYFNDFYIVSTAIIVALLFVIFKDLVL